MTTRLLSYFSLSTITLNCLCSSFCFDLYISSADLYRISSAHYVTAFSQSGQDGCRYHSRPKDAGKGGPFYSSSRRHVSSPSTSIPSIAHTLGITLHVSASHSSEVELTRRKRKELKIRPGFTPQEDVGVFRGTRQSTNDTRKSAIPGSNRPPPPASASTSKPDNPFAQPVAARSKAQLKNDKRREKKRAESTKAWDEESSDEDEGLAEAFAKADLEHKHEKEEVGQPASEAFPPLGGGVTSSSKTDDQAIAAGPNDTSINPSSSAQTPVASLSSSRKDTKPAQKSHPIQGGRNGPIGLAFPPPIEAAKPKTPPPATRSEAASTWRSAQLSVPDEPSTSTYTTTPEAEAKIQARNQARSASSTKAKPPPKSNGTRREKPAAKPEPPKPEPRVRKEVRIRQGGANDIGSLASRVKNLVLETSSPRASPRGKKIEASTEATA